MTVTPAVPPTSVRRPRRAAIARRLRRRSAPAALFALLGVLAALLVGCGGSGKGLIPTANAGPLQSDFEAVVRAAENGDGNCAGTESALLRTEQDFARLPSSVDRGLRETLHRGIENLRTRSLALCAQPLPQSTVTTTTPKTTSTTSTTPPPSETETTATTTTPTATSPPGPGGGTQAPGEEGPKPGEAEGGGASPLEGGGVGGQEAAK